MDIMNKYLEIMEIARNSNGKIKLFDLTCFEYIIFAFEFLIEWTETGRKDKCLMRNDILSAMDGHSINIDNVTLIVIAAVFICCALYVKHIAKHNKAIPKDGFNYNRLSKTAHHFCWIRLQHNPKSSPSNQRRRFYNNYALISFSP